MFRYFQEGEATPMRVMDATAYLLCGADGIEIEVAPESTPDEARAIAVEQGVVFKFTEVTFTDWWYRGVAEDTKALWLEGAEEGTFVDSTIPDHDATVLSLVDGEPVELEDSDDTEEAPA